jgi:hypothetical protein
MSNLNQKPSYQFASDDDASQGLPVLEQAANDDPQAGGALLRGPLRRAHATRLRPPSDDGFRLFRIY